MILSVGVLLVAVYAIAATWARGGGPRRLWFTGVAALGLIVVVTMFLGRQYAVPNLPWLVVVTIVVTAPIVIVPTVLLSVASPPGSGWVGRLAMATIGAFVGLIGGQLFMILGAGAR
jgi:hypothetical protein